LHEPESFNEHIPRSSFRCRPTLDYGYLWSNLDRKMNDDQPKGTISVSEILAYLDRDRYLSKRDATKCLALSVRTLDKWIHEIPHFRIGKKALFKKSELDKWMEHHRKVPQELDLDAIMESALRHVLGEEEYAKRRRRKRSGV